LQDAKRCLILLSTSTFLLSSSFFLLHHPFHYLSSLPLSCSSTHHPSYHHHSSYHRHPSYHHHPSYSLCDGHPLYL
ncbi:hypothetical protein QBC32DRAFT_344028, partial [Pseudoneurospora amorphoporcata]